MLKLYPNDVQAQVGVGLDFYCRFFKFTTEFKMSFGLINLLVKEDNIYATSVQSLRSKMMQVSFIFE